MVKLPSDVPQSMSLLLPFQLDMWISLIVSILGGGVILFFLGADVSW